MRYQLTRFKYFGFETTNIIAQVKVAEAPSDLSASLQSVWVKVFNWDPEARTEHIAREIACMAGDPEVVDL